MANETAHGLETGNLPGWVPMEARLYLAHTGLGRGIRELARQSNCHASTISRQIRKIEASRDDPLVDAALTSLQAGYGSIFTDEEIRPMETKNDIVESGPSEVTLAREGLRVLRRLCETGAVLAVAADMEKAVVVRDTADGRTTRTAVVDQAVAQAMALKDWISCPKPGRISRYSVTMAGRSALSRLLAENESRQAAGLAEAQSPFAEQHKEWGEKTVSGENGARPRRMRFNMAESPLTSLARRKGKDGKPFISDDLVAAGERLREDFELAQMGPNVAQNWDHFLTGGPRGGFSNDGGAGRGPSVARDRVAEALKALGEGLGDVALRCCCYLEGLETAEKRLGWSARSGKIVLRIALIRLREHYQSDQQSQMIG